MKNKLIFITVLLVLTLSAAACGAQEATTPVSTSTADSSTATEAATEDADEAAMTPTGAVEDGTPTQGTTAETGTTPTNSARGGTPSAGAEGTAVIPQTGLGDAGLPDDIDEVIRVLGETGVTVDLGDAVQDDLVSVPGQSILIDGEEVQIFTYPSAEELEAQAAPLLNQNPPEDEPHYYKLGNMLVRYTGSDPLVRDLLEDVLGARAGGQ